ncbi:hypothetical protein F5887DRAFT_1212183 [Amanita rubescens]|nr:hypothetical protein F5887DRAFT_1212183 [Amanita rubescens]
MEIRVLEIVTGVAAVCRLVYLEEDRENIFTLYRLPGKHTVEARAQHRLAVGLSCYNRNASPTSAKLQAPTALAALPSSTSPSFPPSAFESTSSEHHLGFDTNEEAKAKRYTMLGRRQQDGYYGPKYKITKAPPGPLAHPSFRLLRVTAALAYTSRATWISDFTHWASLPHAVVHTPQLKGLREQLLDTFGGELCGLLTSVDDHIPWNGSAVPFSGYSH